MHVSQISSILKETFFLKCVLFHKRHVSGEEFASWRYEGENCVKSSKVAPKAGKAMKSGFRGNCFLGNTITCPLLTVSSFLKQL
jgi:hypothetical protein